MQVAISPVKNIQKMAKIEINNVYKIFGPKPSGVLEMVKNETITGGMIPKIDTCLDAVNNGVTAVGIIDARPKHSILFELFSDKGSGTLIRKWI